ncbi:MAG: hypothetical protein ACRD8Z_13980 [Nitrososphaeraceae archaeon]
MPFRNLTKKYRRQKESTELNYTLSASVEHLDLERKINAITRYQKVYTKKILATMAHANPHNLIIVHKYVVA